MISPYQDKQFQHLRKVIYERYADFHLDHLDLMLRQCEVMEECKEKMERRKAYDSFNNISLNITNISSIQNLSSTDQSSFRNKFTEEFQNSILNAAIKQLKNNCTEETFDTLMGYVINNKTKEYQDVKKQLEKRTKECQELSALVIMQGLPICRKQKDINFLERDLANLRIKEEFIEQEKRKLKKKIDVLDQKEKRLHSAEMSLIFKEKLNLQGKRRYQRQKDINDSFLKQLDKIYERLDSLWDKIFQQMEKSPCGCQKNCWKNQIMKKCKQQLVEQRKILQEQEKQIESQYETLRNLSDQVKKVFVGLNQDSIRKVQDIGKK